MRILPTALATFVFSGVILADDLSVKKSTDTIDIFDGTQTITTYHVGPKVPKPHLWPLHAPDGTPVTAYSPADHVHHKSVWFCHGDVIPDGIELKTKSSDKHVRGVDCWSEHKGHGIIQCVEVGEPKIISKTHVQLPTRNEWLSPDGDKILDESRTLHVLKLDSGYLVVFEIELHAKYCGITFGDTKEGAFGTRVHASIGAPKDAKGTLTANGQRTGEKAIWGEPIDWMDYSGKVNDKSVGLAVFDHPQNSARATSHGRAYGLVAANPFGQDKSFPSRKGKTDQVTMKKDDRLKLKYAVYAHTGDATTADVPAAYKTFSEMK
jgi:hypothetical protein